MDKSSKEKREFLKQVRNSADSEDDVDDDVLQLDLTSQAKRVKSATLGFSEPPANSPSQLFRARRRS